MLNGRRVMLVAGLLAIAFATACSSSDSTSPSSGALATTVSGGGTSVATNVSGAATALASVASGAATSIATAAAAGKADGVCAKIPLADVQALTPQTLSPSTDTGIGECLFHNAGLDVTVDYYVDDTDMSAYTSLSGNGDHPLSGVGDEAYWNEVVPGRTPPTLVARKGNETCTILSNDPPDTTMNTTPLNGTGYTVTDEDALAYVQLLAKVCNDVFAAQ
jgi:hypothetical protein